ncbi:hypothetical protein O6H91_23G057600 [Diphasiastrum complanatum]|uniref:Uncharacterized protein n=2 Tax=Diphasiastrum complanatum TaxID=34168 RepID=A0ACC2AAX7_DIPCM|nr:hypothetical protein O6H91_23G057600 [Diphasiastrum complanatum]
MDAPLLNKRAEHNGLYKLLRRKAANVPEEAPHTSNDMQLIKALDVSQLVSIGVGTTIGAGIFILVGTVAKEQAGPSVSVSFFIAGLAAALSALCYAELASRYPSAGSAYHYAYTFLGEGFAWLVGWALVLEYTVGGSTVARGFSPNLALFVGGQEKLPIWLMRQQIPGTNIILDPCAGLLVVVVTLLLCAGIKESATAQTIMTAGLVLVLLFVIFVGSWIGFSTGWQGYKQASGFLPFGLRGTLGGAATVFFSYIGFDAVASTAEEVKNPQRDLPLGIGLALFICGSLYMAVSAVVVGIVPYTQMNPDTPISSAFSDHGVSWAMYIVAVGAMVAMLTTLLGSFLPQPRILMTMSRDGLLPSIFGTVNKSTAVPVNSTLATGLVAVLMSTSMNVDQLSGMVSVGTLMAFTVVGLCILVLRYVPPLEESSIAASFPEEEEHESKRFLAVLSILSIFGGILLVSLASSFTFLASWGRWMMGTVGLLLLISGTVKLLITKEVGISHHFGHSNCFHCPFVPVLPVASILVNVYLLANIGISTWIRVSVWLIFGLLVYAFYGVHYSLSGRTRV